MIAPPRPASPATVEELRTAYDASSFGRTMSFEAACAQQWTRAALELGARILRRPHPTHVDITEARPSRYAKDYE